MALYRSAEGQAAVRDWCEARFSAWPTAHERRTVPTALGETAVVTTGTGDPAVVLVPGNNLNTATSLALIDALAGRRRVVALDLPGQPGLSSGERAKGDRIPGYGRWLNEVLATVIETSAVLVGHSLGAAVVLSATPSTRVAGIVLVDPAGLVKPTLGLGLIMTSTAWVLRPRPARSARLVEALQAPGHAAPSELSDWFTLVARHTRSAGAPGPLEADTLARWRDTPRRVLTGEHDRFFPPAKLDPTARRALGTDVIAAPDAGHLLPFEHPEAVVDAVLGLSG